MEEAGFEPAHVLERDPNTQVELVQIMHISTQEVDDD